MASAEEARAAAAAACEAGKPVWLAWTLKDGGDPHLRSGETIDAAAAAVADLPIAARLANCCHPESVDAATPMLRAIGGPFGAYANGFTSVTELIPGSGGAAAADLGVRTDLTPERYAAFATGWVEHGASIVGGCCEVGPAHIELLSKRLVEAGHRVVGAL